MRPPKGRPCQRIRPADFEVIFLEKGRLGCETWYRASRITVTRWLCEIGADQLIQRRKAFVSHKRANNDWLTRSTRMIAERPRQCDLADPVLDLRHVPPALAHRAAHFLRIVRNGGWVVSPTGQGDWFVGLRRQSAAQLVDLAQARGFEWSEQELCDAT